MDYRKLVGEIVAENTHGNRVTLPVFQELERCRLFSKEFLAPTVKTVETIDGYPVRYDPEKATCEVMGSSEILKVIAVNINEG
jgi:hypothetical protein